MLYPTELRARNLLTYFSRFFREAPESSAQLARFPCLIVLAEQAFEREPVFVPKSLIYSQVTNRVAEIGPIPPGQILGSTPSVAPRRAEPLGSDHENLGPERRVSANWIYL